jgi:hypothetical protein
VAELHKNSSLRTSLRSRPSLRNRKREFLELEGVREERVLSSGTELEASHPPVQPLKSDAASAAVVAPQRPQRRGDRTSADYMKVRTLRVRMLVKVAY